jgi:chemotaxis protein MotB
MRMKMTPQGVLIEMVDGGDGMLFDLASSKLNEPMERFIRTLAPMIKGLDRKVEINGHTDARPFPAGSKISNWDLSYQRAAAAREILEDSGVSPDTVVGVFARGSSQLFVPDQPYAAQNRRLSFLIKVPETASSGDNDTTPADN